MRIKYVLIPTIRQWHPTEKWISRLYKIYADTLSEIEHFDKVFFDFSECEFFANHACVFLGGLDLFLWTKYQIKITYGNFIDNSIKGYLERIGFFDKNKGWAHLPYSDFTMPDIRARKPYKDIKILLDQPDFPFKTEQSKNQIKENIGELFLNVDQHSNSISGATASAQFYPREKIFRFALVDYGIGISRRVQKFLKEEHNENISEGEALLRALVDGFTTKKDISGLGLKILKDFVLQNKGRISIFCNTVYYRNDARKKSEERFQLKTDQGFNGTYIVIDFDTQQICQ